MSAGKRLCNVKRMHLLKVYLEQGFHAAAPIALRYGVGEKMISEIARENGYRRNYKRGGVRNESGFPNESGSPRDKRWAWAIERGAVVA